ncbi:hypothetical protein E2C01_079290 [Portunus trituberculatus]|uniref:Uncharacterized protein n=1 Tax=Portunus trituberculatus TaxID=210409 RepID=A0A5B7IR18_PORTR|nr:hypothetical protein [Portunus trituberculatus]
MEGASSAKEQSPSQQSRRFCMRVGWEMNSWSLRVCARTSVSAPQARAKRISCSRKGGTRSHPSSGLDLS